MCILFPSYYTDLAYKLHVYCCVLIGVTLAIKMWNEKELTKDLMQPT
jgi:hypothetical protein